MRPFNKPMLSFVAVAAAGMIAAGCGSSDDDNDASGTTAAAAGDGGKSGAKITMISGVKGDEFYITMQCGAQEAAEAAGAEFEVQGPDRWDPSLQTPIVNAVAAAKPDGVLIAPTDSKAMANPIAQLEQGGAKVVLVDTTLDDPSVAVSAISSDNVAGGEQAAEALGELVGGEGKVFVANVRPGISTTDQRSEGFRRGIESQSGLEFVGEEFSDDDPAKAAAITKSILAKHPDLRGIFATNVLTAEGVASGLREAGKADQVKVITFDAGPKNVQDLEEGLIHGLIAQQPAEMGKQGVEQALAAIDGQPARESITTGFVTITRDNLDTPESQAALYKSDC